MGYGEKVFNHSTGIIIIARTSLVIQQLHQNDKFKEYLLPKPNYRIFVSEDIWQEVCNQGLPIAVRKWLCNSR